MNLWKMPELSPEEQKRADEHAKRCWQEERDREALYLALRTRVLTEEEMAEVLRMDYSITIRLASVGLNYSTSESYREEDKRREFNDAIYQQARLRAIVGSETV